MILLDTNVISEGWRSRPNDAVRRWMDVQPASSLFLDADFFVGLDLEVINPFRFSISPETNR
jgi:predicted nucleic acid-binding protein